MAHFLLLLRILISELPFLHRTTCLSTIVATTTRGMKTHTPRCRFSNTSFQCCDLDSSPANKNRRSSRSCASDGKLCDERERLVGYVKHTVFVKNKPYLETQIDTPKVCIAYIHHEKQNLIRTSPFERNQNHILHAPIDFVIEPQFIQPGPYQLRMGSMSLRQH